MYVVTDGSYAKKKKTGAHGIKNEEERGYLVQLVLDKTEEMGWLEQGQVEGGGDGGELILESVRLLGTLVSAEILEMDSAERGEEVREQIEEWIRRKMEEMRMDGSWSRSRSRSRSRSHSQSQSQSQSGTAVGLTRWKKGEFMRHLLWQNDPKSFPR